MSPDTDRPRRTHFLETELGGTCQGMEKNQPSEACSLPGEGRESDLSRHGKKPTDRGALTSWRRQREGLVRTRKETDRPRCTHILETALGGTCQDTEKKPTERSTLTNWRPQREELVRRWKETDRPRRTHILERASGGTYQDTERTNRPRCTHVLETAPGGTCQDTEQY